MSEVRLLIRDATGEWSGTVHGSVADQAIAALSTDPVTFAELEAGMRRFVQAGPGRRFLANLRPGSIDEPHDAGRVIIDLAARLVAVDSTYSAPAPIGEVPYSGGQDAADITVRYHLAPDWHLVQGPYDWRALADERRRERAAQPAIDARAVFYGKPLFEFIARELFARRAELIPIDGSLDKAAKYRVRSIFSDIHSRWLMTPRDDLAGQSPRQVAMKRHKQISWDMEDRCEQWSMVGECPPALDWESHAYRYGGFGTHELVVYYYLVRELLLGCYLHAAALPAAFTVGDFLAEEIPRLEQLREEWLDAPEPEFSGHIPRSIIENERQRIPEGRSGRDHVVDPDCPCCQMLAEMPGPSFWHLDGCNMDDDFAFDISHMTREEFDAERREWEEHSKRFNAEWAERERLGLTDRSLWKTSFAAPADEGAPLHIRLFGIGCHLSELVADLRRDNDPHVQSLIDQLNREFGNVREIAGTEDAALAQSMIEPVSARFCETLDAIGTARPEQAAKCAALSDEIGRLRGEEEIPF
jgi:hypothetical protein